MLLSSHSKPLAHFCHPLTTMDLQVPREERKSLAEVDFSHQPMAWPCAWIEDLDLFIPLLEKQHFPPSS